MLSDFYVLCVRVWEYVQLALQLCCSMWLRFTFLFLSLWFVRFGGLLRVYVSTCLPCWMRFSVTCLLACLLSLGRLSSTCWTPFKLKSNFVALSLSRLSRWRSATHVNEYNWVCLYSKFLFYFFHWLNSSHIQHTHVAATTLWLRVMVFRSCLCTISALSLYSTDRCIVCELLGFGYSIKTNTLF